MNESTQLARYEPSALVAMAIQKDLDIDKLKSLMELQERYEANEAKKAFVKAISAFKKNPPKIVKDMHVEYQTGRGVTKYNHASLGNVVGSITEALSKHDMSVNWKQDQNNKIIKVTCTITHIDGHSESTSIEAPADESGGKNSIQAVGSTITYLQRYTLLSITGLATNEFEDDGRSYKTEPKPDTAEYEEIPPEKSKEKKENGLLEKIGTGLMAIAGNNPTRAGEILVEIGYKNRTEIKTEQQRYEVMDKIAEQMPGLNIDAAEWRKSGKIQPLQDDLPF